MAFLLVPCCAALAVAQGELLSIVGREAGERLGASVGVVGDLDGDGVPEWLVARGAETSSVPRPELQVLSGKDGSRLYDVLGSGQINAIYLQSVLDLGDLDGDDVPEFAFGNSTARVNGGPNSGHVAVHSGATGQRLYLVEGPVSSGAFGASLARLGDLDGDGIGDFLVGQLGTQDENVWLVSGAGGSFLGHVSGPRGGDPEFGWSVAGVGDLDRDGETDFAVGTLRKGVVYVYSSASLRRITTLERGRSFGRKLADLGDLDGDGFHELAVAETGRQVVWITSPRSGARWPVPVHGPVDELVAAGDLDGDRRTDFLVGAPEAQDGAGVVRAFSSVSLRALAKLTGRAAGDRFGAALAGGADYDGDGQPELVIGAPGADCGLRGGDAGEAGVWSIAVPVRPRSGR